MRLALLLFCSNSNSSSSGSSATVNNVKSSSREEGDSLRPLGEEGRRTKDFCREKEEEEEEKETSAELSSAHHLYGLRLDLINDRTTPEATASLSQGTKGDQRTNQRTNEQTHRVRTFIDARGGGG